MQDAWTIGQPLSGQQRFLRSLRGQPVDRPPVWFMRQAGRHLPEYRALREQVSFLQLCREPAVNAEASCQPFDRYGVDAVIVFNDILIPLADMGMGLTFEPGPRFAGLVESTEQCRALADPKYDAQTPVAQCLSQIAERLSRASSATRPALIGFVGAPFTVAAYAVAGPASQRFTAVSQLDAGRMSALIAIQHRLISVLADYAACQVAAGADVIQIFESSAADLPMSLYTRHGLPGLLALLAAIRDRVDCPIIVFGRGIQPHLSTIAAAGACGLGIDHDVELTAVRHCLETLVTPMTVRDASHSADRNSPQSPSMVQAPSVLGPSAIVALQGNLPPDVTTMPTTKAIATTRQLLGMWSQIAPRGRTRTGWIFNLGHGMPSDAKVETVSAIVETVRSHRADRV